MTASSPLAAVRETLAADRALLLSAVDRVPVALRTRKPGPDRWSVQDVLEHLSIVERGALMRIAGLVEAAPRAEAPVSGTPTPFDRGRLANRAQKITAPDRIVPTGALSVDASLQSLTESRTRLLALLDAAEGKDLTKVSVEHPALGPLDGYQWISAVSAHEMRHALQIDEIAAALATA
ncbi:MAG: DinB family protein [Acidobacteria bacterium]|nr:DinB family protein [Acidobacteriota bacterium]